MLFAQSECQLLRTVAGLQRHGAKQNVTGSDVRLARYLQRVVSFQQDVTTAQPSHRPISAVTAASPQLVKLRIDQTSGPEDEAKWTQ